MNLKKQLTVSNLVNVLLVAFVLGMLFVPSFKGVVMQGMMKIGLFQPDVPEGKTEQLESSFAANSIEQDVLFKNMDGEVIELADQKGKVVFINFWATWCPPCIAEMPSIQSLYNEFKGNEKVMFLMVDVDNKPEKSQKFMDKRKFDMPVYTPVSVIPKSYMDRSIPTSLVLNKYGKVVFKHEGMGDYSNKEFATFINQLINE